MWDSEENMVVDPLRQWTDTVTMENVCFGVGDQAEHASCRGQPKIVASVDLELVFHLELDDQPWQLAGVCVTKRRVDSYYTAMTHVSK